MVNKIIKIVKKWLGIASPSESFLPDLTKEEFDEVFERAVYETKLKIKEEVK